MSYDVIPKALINMFALFFFQNNMANEMEQMQLSMGCGHVLYSCGSAFGVDQIAEEMGKEYGMQNEVMLVPNHPRAQCNTPSTVELLRTADEAIKKAAYHLGREVPKHFYTFSLLQRNYHIARKAHTIFAFASLHPNRKEVRGGTGWTVQLALDQCKEVFVFNIVNRKWYRAETHYDVDPATNLLKLETSFLPWGSNKLPTLHQSSAVIGSQIIEEKTQEEVKNLFH